MIIKNSQLNNESIKVINELIELDIDAVAAFKLSRIIKELSSIVEIKIKMEKKIYNKWALKDENGNVLQDIDGSPVFTNIDEFIKEMGELEEIENNIPYDKIKFEDLNLKTAKIKDIIKIEFIFE